jgi:chromatin remodeling complex protein RSC6
VAAAKSRSKAKGRGKTKATAKRRTKSKAKGKTKSKAKRKTKGATKAKAKRKAGAKRTAKAKRAPKAKARKAKTKSKRKPNAAFMKPLQPDEALAAVIGARAVPRTEITKKLWDYIKKNGLQDKVNRRNINADEKLKRVFNGRSTVSMFEMTKLVSTHLT